MRSGQIRRQNCRHNPEGSYGLSLPAPSPPAHARPPAPPRRPRVYTTLPINTYIACIYAKD